MACATCGNRGAPRMARQQPQQRGVRMRMASPADLGDDAVLLEFTGSGTRTFTPPGSGISYRFGEDKEHRQRRVRRDHADRLLGMPFFQLVEEPARLRAKTVEIEDEKPAPRRGRRATREEEEEQQAPPEPTPESEDEGEAQKEE